jgi:hypothetical protein
MRRAKAGARCGPGRQGAGAGGRARKRARARAAGARGRRGAARSGGLLPRARPSGFLRCSGAARGAPPRALRGVGKGRGGARRGALGAAAPARIGKGRARGAGAGRGVPAAARRGLKAAHERASTLNKQGGGEAARGAAGDGRRERGVGARGGASWRGACQGISGGAVDGPTKRAPPARAPAPRRGQRRGGVGGPCHGAAAAGRPRLAWRHLPAAAGGAASIAGPGPAAGWVGGAPGGGWRRGVGPPADGCWVPRRWGSTRSRTGQAWVSVSQRPGQTRVPRRVCGRAMGPLVRRPPAGQRRARAVARGVCRASNWVKWRQSK